jgi:hypothetical protein
MTFRTTTILAFLAVSFVGCDQGTGDSSNDFRDGTSCLKTGTTTTSKLTIGGMDPDWVLSDDDILKFVPEAADEFVMGYARMDPGLERTCSKVCDAEDLGWTGETCVATRDYTLGEVESYETEDGAPRFAVEVNTGHTEAGCACE